METTVVSMQKRTPNKIYRELLKSEAQLIIGTIATLIDLTQDYYDERTKPPHVGRAADDRVGGEVKSNYESGVNWRAVSVVEALHNELDLPINQSEMAYIAHPNLGEFLSQNSSYLQGVMKKIIDLASKL